ncbi:hypothetical protein BMS3Abin10_01744 [bacterium BMS3Abin10]|nr:hypothetical protein BMS3Abin10_01744 [bacterium BMS3Abin10]GBE39111.1 hypothetical protein BMS3Bbin08_01729 [bacterium BMS3Bbin08]
MEKLHKKYRKLWGNEAEMLVLQRKIIDSKPVLQSMYKNFYSEIERFFPNDGLNVEIGTGHGYTSMYFKNLIQTDRVLTPHIAVCNDAQALPYKDGTLDTIMVLGVLHHMKTPDKFFNEAGRVLKKGGKILMVEPYVSILSYPVYKLAHHEGLDLRTKTCGSDKHHLLDANIAIPTIFFKKGKKEFENKYPDLKIIYQSYHTAFLFFVSGGYLYPNLLPVFLLPMLLWIEKVLRPLGKWIGSMMTVVIQKN